MRQMAATIANIPTKLKIVVIVSSNGQVGRRALIP
jgi:hypothetical protein